MGGWGQEGPSPSSLRQNSVRCVLLVLGTPERKGAGQTRTTHMESIEVDKAHFFPLEPQGSIGLPEVN